MSFPDTRNAASPVRRRSFLARTAAAIVAGFAAGNLFRLPAILSADIHGRRCTRDRPPSSSRRSPE